MQAAWLENNTLRHRADIPVPAPSAGEALVKVRLAGICGTDLELVKGYYPFTGIPGHEFVGEIVAAPERPDRIGERVVGEINIVCGSCRACRAGRPTHCARRTVLGIKGRDGALAEYLCLPLKNLTKVADTVSDEAAVFVEPLAAALRIQEQIRINSTDRVLVLGAGRLGQLVARILALNGCELQTAAKYAKQRNLLEKQQISWIDKKAVPEAFFDIVVEATGTVAGFDAARRAVRPGGTIVLKSTYKDALQLNPSALVVDEIRLVGSRCGPFAPALRLLQNGSVDPQDLVEARYPLKDLLQAFAHAEQPGALKVLLQNG
ncbi:MAG: alcohol dehydrogenase catalytic domain-containing protein [Desulfobacterales bacterium]|nr:MAG: alcohol dehydrogenase catalytic domain-containing protein [Desulfobacterales bacterium]